MENLSILLEQFQPTLNEMAVKMGIAMEELWRILLKQQLVDGVLGVCYVVVGLIVLYIAIRLFKWVVSDNDGDGSLILIPFFVGIFGLILICGGLFETVSHFVNPEYQAIKDIFKIINPPS